MMKAIIRVETSNLKLEKLFLNLRNEHGKASTIELPRTGVDIPLNGI